MRMSCFCSIISGFSAWKLEWLRVTRLSGPGIIWKLLSDSCHLGWENSQGGLSRDYGLQVLCMVLPCSLGFAQHVGWVIRKRRHPLREHLEDKHSERTRWILHDLFWSSYRSHVAPLLPHSTDHQWVPEASPDSREVNEIPPLDEEVTQTQAEEQVEWKILLQPLSNKTICHTYDQCWTRT